MSNNASITILPSEIGYVLCALDPQACTAGTIHQSFEGLRELYRRHSGDSKVHKAKQAMETALSTWNDEQVTDFIANYLLEPPYSIETRRKSSDEQRQLLDAIYRYLFDL